MSRVGSLRGVQANFEPCNSDSIKHAGCDNKKHAGCTDLQLVVGAIEQDLNLAAALCFYQWRFCDKEGWQLPTKGVVGEVKHTSRWTPAGSR